MATTKLDPFALVGTTLFNDLNRLFDGPGTPRTTGFGKAPGSVVETWKPRVDVAESDTEFLIRAELPGIDPKDVEVAVENFTPPLRGANRRRGGRCRDDLPASRDPRRHFCAEDTPPCRG